MALSYSALWKVNAPSALTNTDTQLTWQFNSNGSSGLNGVVDLLQYLKANLEFLFGGTFSWTVTTVGSYDIYDINWTGLTTDPATTPSPYDSVLYGDPISVYYFVSATSEQGGFQFVSADLCRDTGECPDCPPSVNPEDATDCPDCYQDEVPFCDTPISILGLEASTDYSFTIVDQATGRKYIYTTTTDINGQADLTVADFPTGLFTPYNGPFTITIFDMNDDPVVLTYGYVNYSCVEVNITNSTDYTP